MGRYQVFAFLALCFSTAVCKLGTPPGPMKLQREPVDVFQAMEEFPFIVAISDWDNDTVFECLASKQLAINPDTHSATYVYILPLSGQKLVFDITPGDSPGTLTLTSTEDPEPRYGMVYYADYDSCVVANLDLQGEQNLCTLWTRLQFKDNVPQHCIDQFVDVCGVIAPAHSRDLCPDGEGDY
ncbi:uncharacterized protein [Dermacentor andersoni]|uniref:uncharacterized protein n=1 Tax=Dermacentor andersoni TaxID=34620 RepID=UPI00241630C4|nr:uncharacterized protein LOC129382442 [Dermacentor andersoni]